MRVWNAYRITCPSCIGDDFPLVNNISLADGRQGWIPAGTIEKI